MSNFKGTKGKWELRLVHRDLETKVVCGSTRIAEVKHFQSFTKDPSYEQGYANALLISKAPEMLEMLETLENDNNQMPEWLWEKIQNLIKEATEI